MPFPIRGISRILIHPIRYVFQPEEPAVTEHPQRDHMVFRKYSQDNYSANDCFCIHCCGAGVFDIENYAAGSLDNTIAMTGYYYKPHTDAAMQADRRRRHGEISARHCSGDRLSHADMSDAGG